MLHTLLNVILLMTWIVIGITFIPRVFNAELKDQIKRGEEHGELNTLVLSIVISITLWPVILYTILAARTRESAEQVFHKHRKLVIDLDIRKEVMDRETKQLEAETGVGEENQSVSGEVLESEFPKLPPRRPPPKNTIQNPYQ